MPKMDSSLLRAAGEAVAEADVLLYHLGAGMSADSGLAVFVDLANVPAYKELGLSYTDLSQPYWLEKDHAIFFGFWGSCLANYRKAVPHEGYEILRKWRESKPQGKCFLYTSNIDAYGRRAHVVPLEDVFEIHGDLETWQCSLPCSAKRWRCPPEYEFDVDKSSMRALPKPASYRPPPFRADPRVDDPHGDYQDEEVSCAAFAGEWPRCPSCMRFARPCILMFNADDVNLWTRKTKQEQHWKDYLEQLTAWLRKHPSKLTIVEVGAGVNVPSLRFASDRMIEKILKEHRSCPPPTLVRINKDYPQADNAKQKEFIVSIPLPAKTALVQIDELNDMKK